MNDRDFMRYSRQILLDDIALDGQQKLLDSQVLIIGLGGLGTPAALYLTYRLVAFLGIRQKQICGFFLLNAIPCMIFQNSQSTVAVGPEIDIRI